MTATKILRQIHSECRDKMKTVSDENIAYIMNSLYMGFPVDGPYLTDRKCAYGGKPTCLDHKGRGLFKSLFFGAYGPAGIVYCIEGSPPRGIVIVCEQHVIFNKIINSRKDLVIQTRYDSSVKYDFKRSLAGYFLQCFEVEKEKYRKNNKDLPKPDYKWENTSANELPL